MGVDWADTTHAVWACDEQGTRVWERTVLHTAAGFSDWGRWLHECRASGIELWAAIERPDGRVVDFLLDHGVTVYPVNPKALDRARDRFRMSGSKSDPFDARVLAEFLRTDHGHLRPLLPNSEAAQELKLLTRDAHRLVRQQTRLLNQLTATLKEYDPRPLAAFADLTTQLARDFLRTYPTPTALAALRRREWERFARAHRLGTARAAAVWEHLHQPTVPVPAHVIRTKARIVQVLVQQLDTVVEAVAGYQEEIARFFAALPAAQWMNSLPVGRHGIMVPTIWAELGDAPGRWQSVAHLQAHGGMVPVTQRSGKQQVVRFRFACNTQLRYALDRLAFCSLQQSEWARATYHRQRQRGHSHHRALRAVGAKWLKIIFGMWTHHTPYDEHYHLANIAKQHLRQVA
jgi:transposase